MKKKIVHIISSKGWRGGEQQVHYILNHESVNYEYYLFCPEQAALTDRNTSKQKNIFTYKKRFGVDVFAALALKKVCTQHEIDLLHIHDSHGINTFLLANLLGLDTPAVVHRHVNFPVLSKWKYIHASVKKIICVSETIRQNFSGFMDEKKLALIHPGIDVQKFSQSHDTRVLRKEINISEKGRIIGMVSALEKEKNIDAFLEIAYAHDKINQEDQFVIIGEGSLLQTFKTQYSLSNVHFMGFRNDIEVLLPSFDVFLFTSVNEGFPLVLLEAMAAKIPVLTNNFPAVSELIKPDQSGMIYKDIPDALAKMDLILNDTRLANTLTSNACNFVQHFDVTLMCNKIEKLYQSVLDHA